MNTDHVKKLKSENKMKVSWLEYFSDTYKGQAQASEKIGVGKKLQIDRNRINTRRNTCEN